MPPRKQSAKALAAEIKKQNTLKAQDIVFQLKADMGKSDSASAFKKPGVKTSEKSADSSGKRSIQVKETAKSKRSTSSVKDKVSTLNENGEGEAVTTLKDTETTDIRPLAKLVADSETAKLRVKTTAAMKPVLAESSKRRSAQDEKTVARPKRTKSDVDDETSSINVEVINIGPFEQLATNSDTRDHVKTLPKDYKSHGRSSSSKESEAASKAAKKGIPRPWKAHSSHGSGYQYEIDCGQVADSIDVKDLQKHLETHLKLDGKKNNLGATVSILCVGHKVVIKSKSFFPKKSLRFLSKKFLKKNWNIRVLSKNVHSYEYKYMGAP